MNDHDILIELRTDLKYIKEKVNSFESLDTRVSKLESWKANLSGRLAVVVASVMLVISLASSVVIDWVKSKLGI